MLAVAAAFGPPVGFAHRPEQVWLGELAIASVNAQPCPRGATWLTVKLPQPSPGGVLLVTACLWVRRSLAALLVWVQVCGNDPDQPPI